MLPGSLLLTLSFKLLVCLYLPKQTVYDWSHIATLNHLFACRIVMVGLLELNIKAGQDTPEFLTVNLC